MIIEVTMPLLGLTMDEGTVLEWSKNVGDKVALDETLLIVETDKAAIEVPSPGAGILARIVVDPGGTVPVGHVISYLAESEGDLASLPAVDGPAPVVAAPVADNQSHADVVAATLLAPAQQQTLPGNGGAKRIFASPRARAKAKELGVDLAAVSFSGERIMEVDVIRASGSRDMAGEGARLTPLAAKLAAELGIDLKALVGLPEQRIRAAELLLAASSGIQPGPAGPGLSLPDGEEESTTRVAGRVRRITAERMTLSAQTIPQVTYQMTCDMTRAVKLRSDLKTEAESRGVRLSFDAMFVRAVATALMEFPDVNSQWMDEEGIRSFRHAHVGVAVDLGDEGLIVPVIRVAESKGLFSIAAELGRLVALAREGKLAPNDFRGGTFTISNLGLLGVETFNPLVNPPEAAILAIGAVTPTPFISDGELREQQITRLALTTDHRILDGAPSARFLARVRDIMERPLLLLEYGL